MTLLPRWTFWEGLGGRKSASLGVVEVGGWLLFGDAGGLGGFLYGALSHGEVVYGEIGM